MGAIVFWAIAGVVLIIGLTLARRHDLAVKRRGSRVVNPKLGLRESRRDLRADPELNRLGNEWR